MTNKIFQYYVFYFLKIENFIRKNIFYLCFFASIFFTIFFKLFINDFQLGFHLNKNWFLVIYYLVMIYIKIRVTVINHNVLNIKDADSLKWQNFINFYELKNTLIINCNFKNIFPFYNTRFTKKISSNFLIKLFTGIFFGYYLVTWYFNFIESIDGGFGVRGRLIFILDNKINNIKQMYTDENRCNSNLKNDLIVLEQIKEKIQTLKLIFFLKKQNLKKINDITSLIRIYDANYENLECINELNSTIKTL